jgi:hypothetical protein
VSERPAVDEEQEEGEALGPYAPTEIRKPAGQQCAVR